ncbi:hypothetical protein DEJ36_15215 [Curtobacterium sp. MCPF17_052]|nr:DUF6716 putative glycosyltransferase [Curtobacterium sp. MCPF17_052]WIB12108.1 hypothetical protein DEJ36_15215 [Curtobacterium sp. MCPF17_052]
MSAPAHDADGTGDGREARHHSTTPPPRRRVVGLVDTDSFAKWGAHLLSAAPAHWSLELLTVATPRSASPAQLRAAFRGVDARLGPIDLAPPGPVGVDEVVARLRAAPPDAVLVSCIGPVAEVVIDQVLRSIPPRVGPTAAGTAQRPAGHLVPGEVEGRVPPGARRPVRAAQSPRGPGVPGPGGRRRGGAVVRPRDAAVRPGCRSDARRGGPRLRGVRRAAERARRGGRPSPRHRLARRHGSGTPGVACRGEDPRGGR